MPASVGIFYAPSYTPGKGASKMTEQQAKAYLDTVGVNLPDFILSALVEQVNSVQECLAAHYSPAVQLLIQSYLLGLMGLGQGDMYITSQTAPSGASRSFRYMAFADRWRGLLSLLRGLDKYGCTAELIPTDPTVSARAAIFSVRGNSCMCGG